MTYSIRSILVATLLLGLILSFAVALRPLRKTVEHVSQVELDSTCPLDALPESAKNVFFSYGGIQTNTYYEFDISESNLKSWVNSLERFQKWHGTQPRRFEVSDDKVQWTVVKDGIAYYWQDPHDADRMENIRFDRSTGRCYYWYMPFYPD